MKLWDRGAHTWALIGVLFLGAAGIFWGSRGQDEIAVLSFLGAGGWYYANMRRSFRRVRIAKAAFPEEWRSVLEKYVSLYQRLSPERKKEFEKRVQVFIGENHFTGVKGVEVTDELKVLAAASAVMLLFGRSDTEYPQIYGILFYPRNFDGDFRTEEGNRNIAGMAHPFGTVVFSVPELYKSFAAEEGYHVGLHEFAHALDFLGQECDGVPLGIHPHLFRPWTELVRKGVERTRGGRGVLRDYAGTNTAEFFAVAVELFFERPDLLRKGNPKFFAALESYFGKQP